MIKKYLLSLGILILFVSVTILLLLHDEYKKNKDEISNRAWSILSLESQKLSFALDDVRSDLNYLALKLKTHNKEDIESDFTNFSTQKRRYDQIRYLDINGMEKIRVDFKNGNSYSIPKDQLQNKKHRYYFSNSIDIDKNSIYISPLDLNIEHGSIEVPIKPMIRFATPVYDVNSKKVGIVIVNYLAGSLLGELKQIRNNFAGEIYLTNRDGYYFVANDSAEEWAFMFPNRSAVTFKNQHNEVWNYINSKNTGKIEGKNGLYLFKTIDLNSWLYGENTIICDGCIWKLIVHVPYSYLDEKLFKYSIRHLPLTMFTVVVIALFLWFLLINYQKREEHEDEIERLNREIINERDIFVAGPTVVFKFKNAYGWPVEYVSKNIKDVLGYEADEFLSKKLNYSNIILPSYLDTFSAKIAIAKRENIRWFEHEPYEVVRKDGEHIWLRDSIFIIRDDDDNITHLYGYIIDVTALKNAQKFIEESSKYIKTVIDTIADPTVVIDVKTYEVVLYNRAAKELYLDKEVDIPSSIKCYQLSHLSNLPCEGSDDPCPIAQILLTKKKTRVTHKHYKRDGTVIYVELIAIPILDEDNNVVQIIESQRDISHHLEYEHTLKELASTDKLTNAYNRTKFDEILQKSFQKAKDNLQNFGLIMFDIDHFKKVNDTYGHDVGDSVLIEIAALVKKHIREHDILVRWGGEEFIIYVLDSDIEILQHIAEHLRSSIEKYDFKHTRSITASFGATMLRSEDSAESLIKRVDNALYASKENGRNRVTVI